MSAGTTLQSLTSSSFHVRGQNKNHVLQMTEGELRRIMSLPQGSAAPLGLRWAAVWLPDRDPLLCPYSPDSADRPGCQVPAVAGSRQRPEDD